MAVYCSNDKCGFCGSSACHNDNVIIDENGCCKEFWRNNVYVGMWKGTVEKNEYRAGSDRFDEMSEETIEGSKD